MAPLLADGRPCEIKDVESAFERYFSAGIDL